MSGVSICSKFDGEKFALKYSLSIDEFWIDGDVLHCPTLPELTNDDIVDCTVSQQEMIDAERRRAYDEAGATIEALTVAMWEKIAENRPEAMNELQAIRERIKAEIPLETADTK